MSNGKPGFASRMTDQSQNLAVVFQRSPCRFGSISSAPLCQPVKEADAVYRAASRFPTRRRQLFKVEFQCCPAARHRVQSLFVERHQPFDRKDLARCPPLDSRGLRLLSSYRRWHDRYPLESCRRGFGSFPLNDSHPWLLPRGCETEIIRALRNSRPAPLNDETEGAAE
jgi:hypothetical protein